MNTNFTNQTNSHTGEQMSLLVTQPNAFILFCREAEARNRRQESWEAGVQQASGVLTVILYDIYDLCNFLFKKNYNCHKTKGTLSVS